MKKLLIITLLILGITTVAHAENPKAIALKQEMRIVKNKQTISQKPLTTKKQVMCYQDLLNRMSPKERNNTRIKVLLNNYCINNASRTTN